MNSDSTVACVSSHRLRQLKQSGASLGQHGRLTDLWWVSLLLDAKARSDKKEPHDVHSMMGDDAMALPEIVALTPTYLTRLVISRDDYKLYVRPHDPEPSIQERLQSWARHQSCAISCLPAPPGFIMTAPPLHEHVLDYLDPASIMVLSQVCRATHQAAHALVQHVDELVGTYELQSTRSNSETAMRMRLKWMKAVLLWGSAEAAAAVHERRNDRSVTYQGPMWKASITGPKYVPEDMFSRMFPQDHATHIVRPEDDEPYKCTLYWLPAEEVAAYAEGKLPSCLEAAREEAEEAGAWCYLERYAAVVRRAVERKEALCLLQNVW